MRLVGAAVLLLSGLCCMAVGASVQSPVIGIPTVFAGAVLAFSASAVLDEP